MRRRFATCAVAYTVFIAVFASNAPSTLYVIYQSKFHFSALILSAIFATYAVTVLVALLVVGRLSDSVGRKPLLIPAVALLLVSTLLFEQARDAWWLFGARAFQGLAMGTLAAAASAALVELEGPGGQRRASLINTLAFLGGSGVGTLLFGLMAQYWSRPTELPFVVEFGLELAALVGVLLLPETVVERRRARWKFQRPSVPREIRKPFVVAAMSVAVGWSVGGIYGSLSASMDRQLLHVNSHAAAGAVLFLFNIIGGVSQLALRRQTARTSLIIGICSTIFGVVLIEIAFLTISPPLFFVATVLAGCGNGMSFVGSLALVNEMAPADRRAEVVAAYNVAAYPALAVPVVGVGLLASTLGLRTASGIFAVALIALALVTLTLVIRRPEGAHLPVADLVANETLGPNSPSASSVVGSDLGSFATPD